MGLKLVTAPADWPITLEQAKAHLRVDTDDDDDLIEALIDAAVESAELFQGRALVDQTWDLYLDAFPCSRWEGLRRVNQIEIRKPPLIEVAGVFYLDSSGAEQTLSASLYTVDTANEPGRVVLKSGSWPTLPDLANAVRVRFRAGYLDQGVSPAVENVPKSTKAAILIMIGDLYANRESVVVGQTVARIPWSAEWLLRLKKFDLSLA
jgi:uncharacterized phiE125 gp8 family phage protein